ncbi:hexosyltransferase [archaeon]|nr:hexosyltransferase [Candidatus Pacearchaeota archaeon]MAH43792.1 hexosyltransferase [archaeon]|tara:strand:+ start:726 stop:1895 length:1170 start_codon:yes stop_codon:yes gene_type:complete
MKIAIIFDMIYPFNIGGTEVRNYELGKRLSKNHEVHLFGVKLWEGPDIIKKDGLTLHGVCRYKNLYNFKGTRTIWEPIKFAIKLYKPLKKEKFDVIDASAFVYFHCFTCKAISTLNKTPLAFTWLQYWGDYWYYYLGNMKGFIGKNIEKLASKLTKYNISISKTTAKDLRENKVKKENIFINYCGTNLKEINNSKPAKEKFDLIFVGRLNHQKNTSLLIKTTNLLKNQFPKIKVCIIGDGPEKNQLKTLTKNLNLTKNITFKGFIENKEEVYGHMKSSKIFVLPSILEGLGIVVIEAHACGLPVIVIDNKWNASKELIQENKNGLISKNNPQQLTQKITLLLENKNLRKQMSTESKESAKQFDWDNIAKDLEKYYTKIKNGNKPKHLRN